jgi:hypothetical protein
MLCWVALECFPVRVSQNSLEFVQQKGAVARLGEGTSELEGHNRRGHGLPFVNSMSTD